MSAGDLVFVGDAHLERDHPALGDFLAFLDRLGESASRVVFLGDLFQLWLGRREIEQPHQTAVVEKLAELRERGLVIRYVEGNRDYRIGPAYTGTALDDAAEGAIEEQFAGLRLLVVHGDLANPDDRSYRRWRRFSRTGPVWHAFGLLPRGRRLAIAESIERRLRRSNPDFKGTFPQAVVERYALELLEHDADAVVLGHFHVERDLVVDTPNGARRVLVLPEWCSSRRHLRVGADGRIEFVDSTS